MKGVSRVTPAWHRTAFAALALLTLFLAALFLAACSDNYRDPVVRACVHDGQPRAYCDCTAQGMRAVLGVERYAVFSDLMVLGGAGDATSQDIVRLMEKHALTPTDFAELKGAIETYSTQIHQQCSP